MGSVAEGVGDGNGTIGVEARLAHDGARGSDGAVTRVAPVAVVLTITQKVVEQLIDKRTGIKRDGGTE